MRCRLKRQVLTFAGTACFLHFWMIILMNANIGQQHSEESENVGNHPEDTRLISNVLKLSRANPLITNLPRFETLLKDSLADKMTRIYFLETSGRPFLSTKDLCAVESAAFHHETGAEIFVLTTSKHLVNDPVLAHIRAKYKQVSLAHINVSAVMTGVGLGSWLTRNKWLYTEADGSTGSPEHLSDVLRAAVLYSSGGMYLDFDVVVLKPLLPFTSFVGLAGHKAGHPDIVNPSTMEFPKGHHFLRAFLDDTRRNTFKDSPYTSNGPKRFTELATRLCGNGALGPGFRTCNTNQDDSSSSFISVYPASYFNLVNWRNWKDYFTKGEQKADALVTQLENNSYVAHYWNSNSRGTHVDLRSTIQPLSRLARRYCSQVARLAGDFLWAFPESKGPASKIIQN